MQWQRPGGGGDPVGQEAVQAVPGEVRRQAGQVHLTAGFLGKDAGLEGGVGELAGQVQHPVPHQVAVAQPALVAGTGQQAGLGQHQSAVPAVAVAAHRVDQVRHRHRAVGPLVPVVERQGLGQRVRPVIEGAPIALIQVRQSGRQFRAQVLLGQAHAQLAAAGHAVEHGPGALRQLIFGAGLEHGVADQFLIQAPAIQTAEVEGFGVGVLLLDRFEPDLQAVLVEGCHGLFQELAQVGAPQRLLWRPVRQRFPFAGGLAGAMSLAPFLLEGEQTPVAHHLGHGPGLVGLVWAGVVRGKIGPAERLQRVSGGQGLAGAQVRLAGDLPEAVQIVPELRHQYRGRSFGIVADAATDPADVQLFPRRQQGFQEQVAVVLTAGAVAGAIIPGHQVEVHRWPRTGVVTVVHAQQADSPEWNGAHRHQGGEVDLTRQESLVQAGLVQAGQQHVPDDGQRQRLVQAGGAGIVQPVLQLPTEPVQSQQVGAADWAEEALQQVGEQAAPGLRGAGRLQCLPQLLQLLDELGQLAG